MKIFLIFFLTLSSILAFAISDDEIIANLDLLENLELEDGKLNVVGDSIAIASESKTDEKTLVGKEKKK